MKPPFETVVADNTKWLMRYIRQRIYNPSVAEDMLQETFLKAFRHYDDYAEAGKIKAWLMRIATNVINNNFTGKSVAFNSIMSFDDDENGLADTLVDDSDSPDDIFEHKETVKQMMTIINNLNDRDREIIYHRYIYDMSVEDVSKKLGIPLGTVKSRTHNTITKIQKQMGVTTPQTKGVHIMNCKELYKYLYIYAKGTISAENKAFVDKHIADCKKCADIVTALKNLIPHINYAPDDELTHFNICFEGVTYSILKFMRDTQGQFGYGGKGGILGLLDNNGNEIEYEDIYNSANDHHNVYVKYNEKTPNPLEEITVYEGNSNIFTQAKESPNLYNVEYCNFLGNQVYTALFTAIPKEATNIRIKRGNGVIDCGTLKFVYVRRYAQQDEGVHINATFNL